MLDLVIEINEVFKQETERVLTQSKAAYVNKIKDP